MDGSSSSNLPDLPNPASVDGSRLPERDVCIINGSVVVVFAVVVVLLPSSQTEEFQELVAPPSGVVLERIFEVMCRLKGVRARGRRSDVS